MRIFDEWGNFIGYIGMSAGDSCLMSIAMVIAFGAFFLIYYFFKLIVEGIKALIEKDYDKAVKYLIVPSLVVLIAVFAGASSVAQNKAAEKAYEQYQIDYHESLLQQKKELETNPPFKVRAWKAECKRTGEEYCPREDVLLIALEITNYYDTHAEIDSVTSFPSSYISGYGGWVYPGETERWFLEVDNASSVNKLCIKLELDLGWNLSYDLPYKFNEEPVDIPEVCLDI